MKEFKVMRKRRRRRVTQSTKNRNRAIIFTAMILCAVVLVSTVGVLCFKHLSVVEDYVPQEPCVIENEKTTTLTIENGQTSILTVAVPQEDIHKLEFVSSDADVLSVDSGGRIDAKKEGTATITAQSKNFSGECTVTVE